MRILIVTTDFLPNISGIATLSYEQALGLHARGHTVKVFTTTHGATDAAADSGVQVLETHIKQRAILRLGSLFRILKVSIAQWQPDFIWCTNYRGFGLPVMALARLQNIPYGLYLHGTELITEFKNPIRRQILKTVSKHATLLCTNSKNTAGLLKNLYGLKAVPVTPGVHTASGDTAEMAYQSAAIRKSWLDAKPAPCPDDERVVFIAVCRMSRQKGIHIVLRSIALLEPGLRERVLFVAVGSGEAALEFEQLADRLLINNNVIFAGPVNREKVPIFLKAADAYLQPSQPEGDFLESFGISFLEAQAAGLPCIGTNWGGVPEAVQGPATAILVPSESVIAVAEAIRKATNETVWRTNARAAAHSWACQNSWDKHVKTIESLLPH